jgi:hypothetical protein
MWRKVVWRQELIGLTQSQQSQQSFTLLTLLTLCEANLSWTNQRNSFATSGFSTLPMALRGSESTVRRSRGSL